jgi:hypothetical protein
MYICYMIHISNLFFELIFISPSIAALIDNTKFSKFFDTLVIKYATSITL